jgi:exosome complex RNA-binding protein Csl4
MANSDPVVCFPGDRLCASGENTIAGAGTYERSGYIYSSLAGVVDTKTEEKVRKVPHGENEVINNLLVLEYSDIGESVG